MKLSEAYPHAPKSVQKALQARTLTEIHVGRSNSHVYRALQGEHSLYLKIHPRSKHFSFAHEVRILEWLNGKLSVPEVMGYEKDASNEYLLLSSIPGVDCVHAMRFLDRKRIVFLLAKGLRAIHALDISSCPFDEGIAEKLRKARYNVENSLVDEEDFDAERYGMTAVQVLDALHDTRLPEDDPVFSHGDYCLPNVLIHHGEVSGYVDLDRAGISDRYNDLAIASRSIRDNMGASEERLFFACYGIDPVDKERIKYYRMMDELF